VGGHGKSAKGMGVKEKNAKLRILIRSRGTPKEGGGGAKPLKKGKKRRGRIGSMGTEDAKKLSEKEEMRGVFFEKGGGRGGGKYGAGDKREPKKKKKKKKK